MNLEDMRGLPEWQSYEATVKETLAEHTAKVIRPWRRLVFWLAVAYLVLLTATVVQWWVL